MNKKKRKHIPEAARRRHMRHRYGIEPEQYEQMFVDQNNQCATCGTTGGDVKGKKLVVDHNHTTGKVRQLLCNRCNHIAGAIEDWRFDKVLDYLIKHSENENVRDEPLQRQGTSEAAA